MKDLLNALHDIEACHRPLNYWGWLENITPEEVESQIQSMHDAGIGGYVTHARGGLLIPYMGEQWRRSVAAMIEKGKQLGMLTIVDDEDGWPSGFGAGKVNGLGPKYQLKWLECAKTEDPASFTPTERTLGIYELNAADGGCRRLYDPKTDAAAGYDASRAVPGEGKYWMHITYHLEKHYVDNMDPDVVAEFIKASYEDYRKDFGKEFGSGIYGIFSDEPQIARYSVSWSYTLTDIMKERFGYDVTDVLPAMFTDIRGGETVRYQYWNTISGLFLESYTKQLYDWCSEHNVVFTGHETGEDTYESMIMCCGNAMPHYEFMHMPGIDFLTRRPVISNVVKQLTSVTQQLGKEHAMCEMFGCAGWNVSMLELKWMAEWHYVLGIDTMVQHLGLYSLHGSRKREYPASLFMQQPWWKDFKPFNDYFARLGKMITESRLETELLVLFPIKTGYLTFNMLDRTAVRGAYSEFRQTTNILLGLDHDFHYGDEDLMKKYGRADRGTVVLGGYRYKCVIVPDSTTLDSSTLDLLLEFCAGGGTVISCGRFPHLVEGAEPDTETMHKLDTIKSCSVAVPNTLEGFVAAADLLPERPIYAQYAYETDLSSSNVYCCTRSFQDGTKFYFAVNTSINRAHTLKLKISSTSKLQRLDLKEMKASNLDINDTIVLDPAESMIIVETESALPESHAAGTSVTAVPGTGTTVKPEGEWTLTQSDLNTLVLDSCEYRIDDGEWEPALSIMNIQKKLIAIGYPVDVELRYTVHSELTKFDPIYLIVEEPEKQHIFINGTEIRFIDLGAWVDKSMRKAEISGHMISGLNEIVIKRNFWCSEKTYRIKSDPTVHEAESNRLTVETELESIFLEGNFDVKTSQSPEYINNRAMRLNGPFKLTDRSHRIGLDDMVPGGMPFFQGTVKLSREIELRKPEGRTMLSFARPDAVVTKVWINGAEAKTFLWGPYTADITELVREGVNTVEIELTNSLRNVFGPFRHKNGEIYGVGQSNFQNEIDDHTSYCLVRFGIEGGITIEQF